MAAVCRRALDEPLSVGLGPAGRSGRVREGCFPKIRQGMGGIDFTFVLAGSAFLLASWVDAKVGDSRPASPAKRIGLCLVGVVVLHLTVGGLYLIQAAGASQAGMMAAVLGLFLPALIFALLTGVWLLRMLVDIAGLARR